MLEFFLVLHASFLQVFDPLLQLLLVDIDLLSRYDGQVSSRFADELGTHLSEDHASSGELGTLILKLLFDHIYLLLNRIHSFICSLMQLLSHNLDLWLQPLPCLLLAVLGELNLDLVE